MSVVRGARPRGLAAAVPERRASWKDHVGAFGEEAEKIAASTGIRERRVAGDRLCASDLAQAAVERLLEDLAWTRDEVDLLVFVSQTPDFFLPATAAALHARLG